MIELLILKIYALTSQANFTLYLAGLQILNGMIVFATFEYHWLKTHDDTFYVLNKTLIRQLDKKTFELCRYLFIVIPMTSIYLWIRLWMQKFSTVDFLKDYGVRRRLL